MDKRTIIFVLLMGITFFGLNFYFSQQRDAKNREFMVQKKAAEAKKSAAVMEQIKGRTATKSALPLVELNSDGAFVAYGVNVDGNTLTLAWNKTLPEAIDVKGKTHVLRTDDVIVGGPVVYAPEGFTDFDIAALPDTGTFDVQLVTFPEDAEPEIFLGEYTDGDVEVPAGPTGANAIALYETKQGWLPLGFYEWRSNAFVELQNVPNLTALVRAPKAVAVSKGPSDEQFYVLENAYQQLVFSTVGGSLVEINLPFKSKEDPDSVVNEIGFDRDIQEQSPKNARFPGHSYYKAGSKELQAEGHLGGYYPLIRRNVAPQYTALNLVSDYPEMAELSFEVQEFTDSKIVFVATQPHRKITKTYTMTPGNDGAPYVLDMTLRVDGDSRGLWLTSGVPEVEIISNSSSPQIQYRVSRKGKGEVEKLSLPKVREVVSVSSVYPDWVVNSNGYMGMIMDPLTDIGSGYRATAIPGTVVPTRLALIDPEYKPYPASKYPGYQVLMPIPTKGGTYNFRFYLGPFEEGVLKQVDKVYSDPETGYTPDYIASRTFFGWFSFITKPFAKMLFVVMSFFHTLTGSWGLSIILLTIFLRLLLYPLNAWSIKSMRRMQLLSPQIQAIQAKHKKDPKKGQMEIMALYREKKVNPFTGCIPIVIQIPFLIAMFNLLKSSFQLRGAVFIPGWINDLTAPDVLFSWKTPIFFIGNQFHLLPILLGGVMFLQQRISSTAPKDPSKMTDQQRQQRTMGTVMTVVFMVMFYHFPSGLNLYWLSSMTIGIIQTLVTNRIMDKKFNQPEVIVPNKKKN